MPRPYPRRLLVALALLALALPALAAPPPARAGTVIDLINARELGAAAEWQTTDGGLSTFVSVTISELATRADGQRVDTPTATVSIFQGDADGNVTYSGTGITEAFAFRVRPPLRSARLVMSLPVFNDVSGLFEEFTVDLEWAGTAPINWMHTVNRTIDTGAGFVQVTRFHGAHRLAVATGRVVGTGGTNFTPGPSTFAVVMRNQTGQLTIVRGS